MEQARKEGRVRSEMLSMKVLKPDLSLQARVNHIDPDHVRSLHEILKNGQPLAPIIVFEVSPGHFKIADGFHRHEVYRREGSLGIPCLVITGSLLEAIEYAASCNQKLSLGRKRDDIQKAAFMLFENGWISKSDAITARHIGVTPSCVTRWKVAYCDKTGIEFPEFVVDENGFTRRRPARGQLTLASKRKFTKSGVMRNHYHTKVGSKHIYLGINRKLAEEKFARIVKERDEKFAAIKDLGAVSRKALAAGVPLRSISSPEDTTLKFISGYKTRRCAVSIVGSLDAESILRSYAETTFIAEYFGLAKKIVLVAEISDSYSGLIGLAKKLGIEFMTLNEFLDPETNIDDFPKEVSTWDFALSQNGNSN